jgi:ElaB/YqjD/DUF883 family membrane-anchored ribosome-binding protein
MREKCKHGQVKVWSTIENDWVWRDFPVSETDQLKEATREAHEAMKDLRDLMREVEPLLDRLRVAAHEDVDKKLTETVAAGLAEYERTIKEHADKVGETIIKRFDGIYDLLMGKTPAQKRRNGVDMEQVIGLATVGDPDAVRKMIEEAMKVDPIEGVVP